MNKAQISGSQDCYPLLGAFPTVSDAVSAAVVAWGPRAAIDDLDNDLSLTYGDVGQRIASLRNALAFHGLKPGNSLATNLDNSPELILLILASLTYGLRLALVEPQVPHDRLGRFYEMVNPSAVFVAASPDVGQAKVLDVATLLATGPEFSAHPAVHVQPDDEAIVIFSSGTTGASKGIVHSQANILAEVDSMSRGYGAADLPRHQLVLTLAHVSGLYRGLLMPFLNGSRISLRRAFAPETFWADMVDHGISFVQLVPSHVAVLNRSAAEPAGDLQLKMIGTASAYLPPKEQLSFEGRFGIPLLQGYGMTECTCGITLNSLDPSVRRPGVVGRSLDVNVIRILDSAGVEVEEGEVGELYVKGRNVARRFLGEQGPSFDGEWLKTGDFGKMDANGNITLLGRRTNIINRGAYKVYATEIEDALRSLPGVQDAAVIGVPHPLLGEDVQAFVTPADISSPFQLLGQLRSKLASYKVPSRIICMEALPRNKMGKMLKDELLRASSVSSGKLNRETIMDQLARVIADLFGLAPGEVPPEFCSDDEPRWDSFGHIQVILAVEQEFGIYLELHDAFAARSIYDLAKLIEYVAESAA